METYVISENIFPTMKSLGSEKKASEEDEKAADDNL
jgi:hypothetical protein